MVNPVINPDPTALRAVAVPEIAGAGQLLPALAVGEVARIIVRQAQQEGLGLILLQGQLIKAALPQNVKAGDTLVAQVTDNTDQLLFKILNVAAGETPDPTVSEKVTEQLQKFTYTPGSPGLKAPQPFNVPTSLPELQSQLELSKSQLGQLFKAIATTDDLMNAKNTLDQMLATADGSTSKNLKEVAKAILSYVERNTAPPADRVMHLVKDELFKLLDNASHDNRSAAKTLDQLTELVEKGVKEAKKGPERDALRATLRELGRPEGQQMTQAQIEKALAKLETAIDPKEPRTKVDPKALEELKQIAFRLEQMATTQDMLNTLNPVMQALGEPAMILLPFLFQGLISHTEVTIDTHVPGKKKGEREEQDGEKKKRSESYHRIQVNVPLPSMGNVAVDIAHKQKEIMVRMTVESQEAGSFLLEQLEHLAVILKEQGFESAELVAHVGVKRENLPAWTLGLHAATSVLA